MATIPFSSAGAEVIDLSGNGGTDDAIITNYLYINAGDTISGATGSANKLIYDGTSSWTFDTTGGAYSGFSGLEGLKITSPQTATISLNDGFVALNKNAANVFSIDGGSANGLTVDGTLLSAYALDIKGSGVADQLTGSYMADYIKPGLGADSATGGSGADTFGYTTQTELASDTIDGGADIDAISLAAGVTYDLSAAAISNVESLILTGDGGNAVIDLSIGGQLTSISAVAGGAVDRLGVTGGITLNMSSVSITGVDVIYNSNNSTINLVLPNNANLQYQGGSLGDSIMGGTGHETIFGGSGAVGDTLNGYEGNDALIGGGGADCMTGGLGNDLILGGPDAAPAADSIDGGDGNDTINGYEGLDNLIGNYGDDLIFAGDGGSLNGDTLQGDYGNDTLVANQTGTSGVDHLYGGYGNDVLFGGAGGDSMHGMNDNDTLVAGDGSDTLLGGMGNDVMWGDTGIDYFIFLPNDGNDTIADFVTGVDKLNLTGRSYTGSYTAFLADVTLATTANGLVATFTDGSVINLVGVSSLTVGDLLL